MYRLYQPHHHHRDQDLNQVQPLFLLCQLQWSTHLHHQHRLQQMKLIFH